MDGLHDGSATQSTPAVSAATIAGNDILITGGAGFIGSNLANALAGRNDVVVVDDGSLGIEEALDADVELIERSVLEPDLPTAVDVCFHLAGLSSYSAHESDQTTGVRVNVEGFVNVLEQARKDGCRDVVYASTISVYDDPTAPTGTTVAATTGCEASCLARERYAEYFASHYGMNVAGLRLTTVYQAYRNSHAGEPAYPNVVAELADTIAHGRRPVLYGSGERVRDFTHVEDVVRGLIAAANHRLTGIYDLGTGRGVTSNELVAMLADALDRPVQPTYVDRPTPDGVLPACGVADSSKFHAATGWQPEIPLESGIERVCRQQEVPTS